MQRRKRYRIRTDAVIGGASPPSARTGAQSVRSRSRLGLTLIELMVGVFIALFLTAAAVAFASHETKLLGYSNDQIDLEQSGRAAIDLLTQDIRMAGSGIGYGFSPGGSNGTFLGLKVNTFTVGAAQFNDAGTTHTLTLNTSQFFGGFPGTAFNVPTQDLMIQTADGSYASIAWWNGVGGEYCTGNDVTFLAGDQVLLRDSAGLAAISGSMAPTGAVAPCTWGQCLNGCFGFTFNAAPGGTYVAYQSDSAAATAQYIDGELMGGFKQIVWFVDNQAVPYNYAAQLRRVVFDGTPTAVCGTRAGCGLNTSVADYVEALTYQVWTYNTTGTPPGWQIMQLDQPLIPVNRTDRIRVDLEIVVRSHIADDHAHQPAVLRLQPAPNGGACIPGGGVAGNIDQPITCPGGRGAWDRVVRKTYRTSVEVKNSGREQIQ